MPRWARGCATTSIVSSVSGQFGRSLVLGTLFPVLLFVMFGVLFWLPLFPDGWAPFRQLEALDPQWRILVLSFVALLLTGVLYNLNIPLIRLYEGYPWKHSCLGEWRVKRHTAKFEELSAWWRGLRPLRYFLQRTPGDHAAQAKIVTFWGETGHRCTQEFPVDRPNLVLPTRLGNVIRSFEVYPDAQYKMDAIFLWPRLIARIDKVYAEAIDEAKATFDFTLNASALSAALGLGLLVTGLAYPLPFSSNELLVTWLCEVVGFLGLGYLMYLVSIGRAGAWGDMVKAAFDLYRWDLLKQLGFAQPPADAEEEHARWESISQHLLFGSSPRVPEARYAARATSVRPVPDYVQLDLARGVSAPDKAGVVTITIQVKNVDRYKRVAQEVVIVDAAPDGFEYVWNSAWATGYRPDVSGANPYRFHVGQLGLGDLLVLSYRIAPRVRPLGAFELKTNNQHDFRDATHTGGET